MNAKSKAGWLTLCLVSVSTQVLGEEKKVAVPTRVADGTSLVWLNDRRQGGFKPEEL